MQPLNHIFMHPTLSRIAARERLDGLSRLVLSALLIGGAALVSANSAWAGGCHGRIVVANDDWTLSDAGFSSAPTTTNFALNVASWFTNNKPGNFLVRSTSFALTQSTLASTMTGAGHTWVIDPTAPDATVADLLPYDAVFLCQTPTNMSTLTAYVQAGGCVYVAGGTANDANNWDPFLHAFGLDFGGLDSFIGNAPVASSHPLFNGVTSLFMASGNDVIDFDGAASARSKVLVSNGGFGQFGIFDGRGRVILANDDFTLSDGGFSNAPTTTNFALNIANWFTGNQSGNFLVRSNYFAVTDGTLASTMTGAGHTWTINSTAPDAALADLLPYDAVFLAQTPTNVATLSAYVQAGGCVYLAGGTFNDATNWDTFANPLGLDFGGLDNYIGPVPISSSHPLFQGVTSLFQASGNDVTDLAPSDPSNQVLATYNGFGLFGIHDDCECTTMTKYCTAKINSNGCAPTLNYVGPATKPSVTGAFNGVLANFSVTNLSPRPGASSHKGQLFYSTVGAQGVPFVGGTLCVKPSIKRIAPVVNTGGSIGSTTLCDSSITVDFNARIQSGLDPALIAGASVWIQGWARDIASSPFLGIQLSDACTFVIGS